MIVNAVYLHIYLYLSNHTLNVNKIIKLEMLPSLLTY